MQTATHSTSKWGTRDARAKNKNKELIETAAQHAIKPPQRRTPLPKFCLEVDNVFNALAKPALPVAIATLIEPFSQYGITQSPCFPTFIVAPPLIPFSLEFPPFPPVSFFFTCFWKVKFIWH